MSPVVQEFFDATTSTLTYVVFDEVSKDAVLIDPVWDYDPAASKLSTQAMDRVLSFIQEKRLNPKMLLETHAHADHVSASSLFKKKFPELKVGIGEKITAVQKTFKEIFNLSEAFVPDGRQFDLLFKDGEVFRVGPLSIRVFHTPGHTPACVCYHIGDCVFTGDALFMPDSGTGRCDFPGGSAETLYQSIHEKIYRLPDETKIYVGHDYQPGGRELKFVTTVGEEKKNNIQLKDMTTQEEFISFRKKRDASLSAPRLLLPSLFFNINAGKLPPSESNGISYLKIPIF